VPSAYLGLFRLGDPNRARAASADLFRIGVSSGRGGGAPCRCWSRGGMVCDVEHQRELAASVSGRPFICGETAADIAYPCLNPPRFVCVTIVVRLMAIVAEGSSARF